MYGRVEQDVEVHSRSGPLCDVTLGTETETEYEV